MDFRTARVEPLGHIVLNEFFYQVAQMSLAEDDEVIETLVLDGLYKALRVWIAIWTLRRNLHALHASRFQNRDERLGEQRISIVDQVLRATKKPINRICQISCHLLHPRFAWVNGNPGDLNGPTLELDDEEHHVPNRAEWPQGFHAEEIAGVERVPMALHELLPGPLPLALRCRLDPFFQQDVGHRRSSDLDLQSGPKGVAYFRISPAQIRQGHSDHQLADVLLLPWSTDLLLRAVVFLRRHLAKPPQERPRLHDLAALFPLFRAQSFAGDGEATTLVGCEYDPIAARGSLQHVLENPDLFLSVVQLALHSLVDRACDHRDEKLERCRKH
jgi:hypothetical protein